MLRNAEFDKLVREMKDATAGYGYAEVADFYRGQAEKRKAAEDAVKN